MKFTYEVTECPLCHSTKSHYLTTGYTNSSTFYLPWLPKLTWHRCDQCDHIYRKEGFTEEGLQEIFSYTPEQSLHNINQYRMPFYEALRSIVYPGCKVLDIGVGSGAATMVALELGADVSVIEIRKDLLKTVEALDITRIRGDITTHEFDTKYDVVLAADIIEHVADPTALITKLSNICRDVLFISTPNGSSPFFKFDGKLNPYWSIEEQLHIFTKERLYNLLHDLGLDVYKFALSDRYRYGMDLYCYA